MSTTQATPTTATTWKIDPAHTHAQFKVRHMMISNVKGEFTSVSGSLQRDETDASKSHLEATIDAASINTRDAQRDAHLKSADFLDVEKYPVLTFRSTKVGNSLDSDVTVAGDLTIRGVTRPVVFEVEGPTPAMKDPWGNVRIGASATTKISRKDFGLNWNAALETGGVLVGDEVTITLDVEFVKA